MTLKTPQARLVIDPVAAMVASVVGGGRETGLLGEGLIEWSDWNPEFQWHVTRLPWGEDMPELFHWGSPGRVPSLCVVDSPSQWVYKFAGAVDADPGVYCVFFVHIAKEPENRGRGGGWRWHKWGEYVGDGSPQCEYLDDEPGFDDGVWTADVAVVCCG